jgi:hypothetical protein
MKQLVSFAETCVAFFFYFFNMKSVSNEPSEDSD